MLEALKLTEISDRAWQIQACSAMNGEGKCFLIQTSAAIAEAKRHLTAVLIGLQDGLAWLIDTISKIKAEQAK